MLMLCTLIANSAIVMIDGNVKRECWVEV